MKTLKIGQTNTIRFELTEDSSAVTDATVDVKLLSTYDNEIADHSASLTHDADGVYEGTLYVDTSIAPQQYKLEYLVNGSPVEHFRETVEIEWPEPGDL